MGKKKQRPGVMLYFDTWRALQYADLAEKGMLMEAMMDYGEYGVEPQLPMKLAQLWPFLRMSLDRDKERYEETCRKRSYAAYVRNLPTGAVKMDFEEWMDE